ncbi:M56 family metallopeptidase [Zhouia sp. PK063]|uniref:M56 family metallopeptidase n=1 Tax=Zhouia sp. PK063 TaxID=3373602 RepID=UPI00379206DE
MVYFIKVFIGITVVLAFYKLLLEREEIHKFKRFFLLSAIVLVFLLPLIQTTKTVLIAPVDETVTEMPQLHNANFSIIKPSISSTKTEIFTAEHMKTVLWALYLAGVVFFTFKFFISTFLIYKKIKQSKKSHTDKNILVLLQNNDTPHTFFKYIFLNRKAFEANQIPQEILIHEEAHANQYHSIDVILIEILKVIFWFNPVFYWYENAVKLNHEFLADQSVLSKGFHQKTYQEMLLSFLMSKPQHSLVNSIHYSLIKKRFTIMKKQTSLKRKWLITFLVIPFIALLAFSFKTNKVIYKTNSSKVKPITSLETPSDSLTKDEYYKNTTFIITDENGKKHSYSYAQLNKEIVDKLLPPPSIPTKKVPTIDDLKQWEDKNYGIWIDNKLYDNAKLKEYRSKDFSLWSSSRLYKNAKNYNKYHIRIDLYTNSFFENQYKDGVKPFEGKILMDLKNNKNVIKGNLQVYINRLKKYDELRTSAPHYLRKSDFDKTIISEQFKDLQNKYATLSTEQKQQVLPPKHPMNSKIKLIDAKGTTYYKNFLTLIKQEVSQVAPPPPSAPPKILKETSTSKILALLESRKSVIYYKNENISIGRVQELLKNRDQLMISYNEMKEGTVYFISDKS